MSDLPTKPGPYYWRKSDGDKWVHTSVVDCLGQLRGGNARRPYQEAVSSMGGQWLPIPTADELVELQATKKAVDGLLCLVDDVYEWRQHIPGPEFCELRADIQALGEYATVIRKAKR